MRFKMMAFVAMVSLAVPAMAQTAAPTDPAPQPKKERKLCRSLPATTGSNMVKMVCHTKTEWAYIEEHDLDPTATPGMRSGTEAGNMGPGVR